MEPRKESARDGWPVDHIQCNCRAQSGFRPGTIRQTLVTPKRKRMQPGENLAAVGSARLAEAAITSGLRLDGDAVPIDIWLSDLPCV